MFETLNNQPSTFEFVSPKHNEIIQYVNGKLLIETTVPTDNDDDSLTKYVRLEGPNIDTTYVLDALTTNIYVDSSRLQSNTIYRLYGEVTDGKLTTQAINSNTNFRTPVYTSINSILTDENLKVYPNPVSDYIQINIVADNSYPISLTIELFDIAGRLHKKHVENMYGQYGMNLFCGDLSTGLYLMQIQISGRNNKNETTTVVITKQ
jgi:hypothetical protein